MLTSIPRSNSRGSRRREGTVLVLMVLLLPLALLMSAIAINLAYIELSRTELIIATDAATRAGGRELIKTGSQTIARTRAQHYASINAVAGSGLNLSITDVQFGTSTRGGSGRYNFTVNPINPNSIRIQSHRDSANANGPIPMIMPSILGMSSVATTQEAISTQMEVDVGLVIDRSGSMAFAANEISGATPEPALAPVGWNWGDPAPPGSRWLDLVAAVNTFTNELATSPGSELLSLSTYNHLMLTDMSLTSNYAAVLAAMNVYTLSFANGATNIGGGITKVLLRCSPVLHSDQAPQRYWS